jgi:hypothetical protein
MRRGAHLAEQRIGTTGIAQATAQFAQPAEEIDAGLDLEQQPIGQLDGHLRRECGRDARQPLHEFQLTYGIAWTRIDAGHGRERGTQGHADAHARRPRFRVRVDDALPVLRIHDDQGPGQRRGLLHRSYCQQWQLRHMRSHPQLARLEPERALRFGSLGWRRRRPHP